MGGPSSDPSPKGLLGEGKLTVTDAYRDWETQHPPHPCEGDVMPVLQMRKLRPRAEVPCARPQLSQDVLTWRQGGPGPSMADCLPARLEDLLHAALACLWTAWSGRDPAARVRLGSAAGSGWHFFKASPGFLASWADCLPPPEEGSLLSGLISCQLSVFFLCFCCSLRQTGRGGQREKAARARPFPGLGASPLCPAPSGLIPLLSRPSRLLGSGLVLSPDWPTVFHDQVLSSRFGSPYLTEETLHVSPRILKGQAKLQTPGYDIPDPQNPGLCCSPISFHGSTLFSAGNDSFLPHLSF